VSSNFMNMKSGVKKALKNSVNTSNPTLEKNLKAYFGAFNDHFSSCMPSADQKKKIIGGITCLVHVFREKYFTPSKIITGFLKSGEHLEGTDPARGEVTVNYDLVMAKTTSKRSKEELDFMREKVPQVVSEMRRTGMASNAFLDGLGIAKDETAKDRDGLVIDKQDAQLITKSSTSLSSKKVGGFTAPANIFSLTE